MYYERMNSYYPEVIRTIAEFQGIIDSEYPEFEGLEGGRDEVINDAYLPTMSEARISQWEQLLNIKALENSTLDDRRDTIIARIRGTGKLNTELISSIVNAFTGGSANSWVKDSTLYVEITPPPTNKQYRFENVESEINKRVPAHLGLNVSRNYSEWSQIKSDFATWGEVKNNFDTWNDVYLYVPFNEG